LTGVLKAFCDSKLPEWTNKTILTGESTYTDICSSYSEEKLFALGLS